MSDQLRALLDDLYTPAQIDVWLTSPQRVLQKRRPADMIAQGDEGELIHILQSMLEGIYR